MVSAIPFCLLAIGLAVVSSQQFSEVESPEAPVSDRRTFKHGKPVKVLPIVKKHKKFPHVFGKTSFPEVPVFHEVPRPLYKFHGYQGLDVKPFSDVSVSTAEPFIETHSLEPPVEFQHPFPASFQASGLLLLPVNDKPVFASQAFSSPHPGPVFASLPPPPPPKPIISFVPAPAQPAFPSLPITSGPSIIPVARPVFPQPPVFSIPIKIQPPVLPPLPSPTPQPVFPSLPVKIPAPIPASPAPPVFQTVSITQPQLTHPFPSVPPPSPSPIPSFQALPPSSPALPEPEFPYPPSGVPIPSYIKDISLTDVEIKDTPLPTLETPKFQEVTPAVIESHPAQTVKVTDDGLLQKLKGWKAEKANAALTHFNSFKQKPFGHFSIPFHYPPTPTTPAPAPIHPTLQFPAPPHPLPLAQSPSSFFPPAPHFFPPPPPTYDSFPPNHSDPPTPPLFNSYGAPLPHDRLSAASEEQPAVIPPPKEQKSELQQRPTAQLLQEFQFQQQSTSHIQPVYVPEDGKSVKEEAKTTESTQSEADDYSAPKEDGSDAQTYPNHKE